jgi:co-chaperonin GroES (HSP10)
MKRKAIRRTKPKAKPVRVCRCRILPTDDHILIEYLPASGITPGGIFIPQSATENDPTKRQWDRSYEARVLAVGPGRIKLDKKKDATAERIPMTVKAGDLVMIRQQNFPIRKQFYFDNVSSSQDMVYFARESDINAKN